MTTIHSMHYPWLPPTPFHKYARRGPKEKELHPVFPWYRVLDFRFPKHQAGMGLFLRCDGRKVGGWAKDVLAFEKEHPLEVPEPLCGQVWVVHGAERSIANVRQGSVAQLPCWGLTWSDGEDWCVGPGNDVPWPLPGMICVHSPNGQVYAPPGWLPEGTHFCENPTCPGRAEEHECG